MNAIKPATPLPWIVDDTDAEGFTVSTKDNRAIAECGLRYSSLTHERGAKDAAYIVHAANAYPRLLAALRQLQSKADALIKANWIEDHGQPDVGDAWEACDKAAALLDSLGERA